MLGLLLVLQLTVVACATKDTTSGDRPLSGAERAPGEWSIQGVWRVESIVGAVETVTPPTGGTAPVIDFGSMRGDGRSPITGSSGVNRFFGEFAFSAGEGEIGALSISQLGSTRMAGPPESMQFEALLLETLRSARTVRRVDEGLIIDCAGAEVILRSAGRR